MNGRLPGVDKVFFIKLYLFLIIKKKNLSMPQVVLVVKNSPANAGDIRDEGSIPGSRRSPGGETATHSSQYSCLENPLERGAWWITVHMVTESQT